jgi:hypothetical protein
MRLETRGPAARFSKQSNQAITMLGQSPSLNQRVGSTGVMRAQTVTNFLTVQAMPSVDPNDA